MKAILMSLTMFVAQASFANVDAKLLTSAPLCHVDTDGDGDYGRYVLNADGTGAFGPIWDGQEAWKDNLTWTLNGNTLQLTLPSTYSPNVWTHELEVIKADYPAQIRFKDGGEVYQCQ